MFFEKEIGGLFDGDCCIGFKDGYVIPFLFLWVCNSFSFSFGYVIWAMEFRGLFLYPSDN